MEEKEKKTEVKGMGFVKGALVVIVGLKAVDLAMKFKAIGVISETCGPIVKGFKSMFGGNTDDESKD